MTTAGGETLPETTFRFDVAGGEGGDWKVVYLHASEKLSRVYEGTLLLAHALPAPDARPSPGPSAAPRHGTRRTSARDQLSIESDFDAD